MKLTQFSDYSLRVLIYLALNQDRLSTIGEISNSFKVSHNHLVKIAHQLNQMGFIETVRGRSGGMRLKRDPSEINIGEVVRATETNLDIVECFNKVGNTCTLTTCCKLSSVLDEALNAFLKVLESYSLEDLLAHPARLRALIGDHERAPVKRT